MEKPKFTNDIENSMGMKEKPKFTNKFEDALGIPDLSEKLIEAKQAMLNSILIETFREKAKKLAPSQVFKEYISKPEFYSPGQIDQRDQNKFNSCFSDILPDDIPMLDLSPIAPFGTNVSITNLSQDVMCTSIRGNEVQGDSTTALSIEASKRRMEKLSNQDTADDEVKLATISRVLRMQKYDQGKGYMQHYNLFGLFSAGRNRPGGRLYSVDAMEDHISIWLSLLSRLEEMSLGKFSDVEVKVSDMRIIAGLVQGLNLSREVINKNSLNEDWDFFREFDIDLPAEVQSISDIPPDKLKVAGIQETIKNMSYFEETLFPILRQRYPHIKFTFELNRRTGLGYYDDYCFNMFAKNTEGNNILVAAGGAVGWTSKFLGNKKEKAFASGFGSELIQKLFKRG